MDPIFFYILTGVFFILLIKFKLLFIFFPSLLRRFGQSPGISGPGGHRYITDMKHKLSNFNPEDLCTLSEAQYDRSVNFRVGGIISHYKDEKKSLLSFYGDFVFPKDDMVRQNRLLGSLKVISSKDEMEVLAENNSLKLFQNKNHIASITAGSRRILNPSGKELGLIEGPEYMGDNILETRKVLFQGEEIGEYRFLTFSGETHEDLSERQSVFQSVKPDLSEFQKQILTFIVILDIYYTSLYYFEKKS